MTEETFDRDTWRTPDNLLRAAERFLNMPFMLDVCANATNTVCDKYYSIDDDALRDDCDWSARRGAAWMNPPYSDPAPWCAKAASESERRGIFVVGLLPDDRSTRWYQQHIEGVASLALVPDRRVAFLHPLTGEPAKGNPKGSVIPIWTPWRTGRTEYIRIKI